MSRSVDSSLSISLRVWFRKQFEAMRRRQNSYSLVSATLPALTAITLLIDIIGSPQQGELGALVLSLGFFVTALLVLVVGKTLPKWAGLILVTVITLVAVFATQNERPHDEVNALLIAPLVGLYLGWFHRTLLSRLLGGALLLVLLIAGVQREPHSLGYSVFVAVGHAVAIAALCFEAAASLRRRLDRQAVLDPLTGVLNRRGLVEAARKAMAAARKRGTPLSLALIDLDDFKRVNDEGGHQAGDEALCETAKSWVDGFGPGAVVARIGGDEFVLLVAGDSSLVESQLRAIRGRARFSWSWGLAQLRDEDTLRALMKRADRRMYRAKDVRET